MLLEQLVILVGFNSLPHVPLSFLDIDLNVHDIYIYLLFILTFEFTIDLNNIGKFSLLSYERPYQLGLELSICKHR